MNIQEFRQQYPEYSDLSDVDLAKKLHKKYYSDLGFEDFAARFGVQTIPIVSESVRKVGTPWMPMVREVQPDTDERGFISETGAALTRSFLRGAKGVTGTLVGAMREEPRYSPMTSELLGATEEEHKEIRKSLQTATRKIQTAEQKFPRTWEGPEGWALNTVAEAVGYMGQALAGGYIAGPVGAAMVAFGIEGQEAYENAIETGATEEQANTERVIVGSLNAAIEALQINKLMKFQKAGKHSIVAFKDLIKKKAYKELKKAGRKFTKDVLKTAIEEGAEEFLQEGVSLTVPAILRGEYPKTAEGKVDVWAIGEQLGAATLGGTFAGGILGAGGAVTLAAPTLVDPSIQKIEQAARTIQADEKLSEFEKARAIAELRKMLPEDYEYRPEVVEEVEGAAPINVYQDVEGNNYHEEDLIVEEIDGNRVPVAPNGMPVQLNPELSGTAIETEKPVSPFHISEQAQKVIDVTNQFEKTLSEYEAKRPEETKEKRKRMDEKIQEADRIFKEEIAAGEDPEIAMTHAKQSMEGLARTIFPEFAELFSAADIHTMRQAVAESTLTLTQKFDIEKVFMALTEKALPYPSSIKAFDKFFGTNISQIGKNKPRTWKQKFWHYAKLPGQTVKAMLASFDFSAGGIQGFGMLLADPKTGGQNIARGYREALSPKYAKLREIQIKTHPYYNVAKAAGLEITETGSLSKSEEEFADNLAVKIPGFGKGVEASERAHVGTLSGMRADYFYKQLEQWGGPENVSFAQIQELAQHANNLTGRGMGKPGGWFERHMDALSFFFWVPRMFKATVAAPTDFITKPHIRKMAAANLIRGVGIIVGYTFLAGLWAKEEDDVRIEMNPLSSDFGKIIKGNTRQNIWGRWGRLIRTTCQLVAGKKKSPRTGEIFQAERWQIFTDYLRSLTNPLFGAGVDVALGETFLHEKMQYGDPEFMTKYIAEHVTPLFIQDLIDAARFSEGGVNPFMAGLAAHGLDMTTYEIDARQKAHELKNDYAHQYYGKDWAELGPGAQALIRGQHPMIVQYEEDAKREQQRFVTRSNREKFEDEAGEKLVRSLPKDLRQMYENTGAKIPRIQQGVNYNGNYWGMRLDRYEKFQKDIKPNIEKALRNLKSMANWERIDSRVQRQLIEETTKAAIRYARQQMIGDISMADLEAYNERTTE